MSMLANRRLLSISAICLGSYAGYHLVANDPRIRRHAKDLMPFIPWDNIINKIETARHFSLPEYKGQYEPTPGLPVWHNQKQIIDKPVLPDINSENGIPETILYLHKLLESIKPNKQVSEFEHLLFNLQSRFNHLKSKMANDYEKKLKFELDSLKNELTQDFVLQKDKLVEDHKLEISKILEKHFNDLEHLSAESSISTAKQLQEQAAALHRQFQDEIISRVDSERNGRLSRVAELAEILNKLSKDHKLLIMRFKTIKEISALEKLIRDIKKAVNSNQNVLMMFENLKKQIPSNDTLSHLAANMVSDPAVPCQKTIISRFDNVEIMLKRTMAVSELKKLMEKCNISPSASIGLLEYTLSHVFDKVFSSNEYDILKNAKKYMKNNEIESAARELNKLKGISKKVAKGWIESVRNYITFEEALEIIRIQQKRRFMQQIE